MIHVACFQNALMQSNCYVIYSDSYPKCIVIDPASQHCENIMPLLKAKQIVPAFVITSHEHVDHTWGCNYLRETFRSKLVCSKDCFKYMNVNSRSYFQLYYDDCEYDYTISKPDLFTDDLTNGLLLNDIRLKFLRTPGHSLGSICISIDGIDAIFGGDTLLQTKPYIAKPTGNKQQFANSLTFIKQQFNSNTLVYPGHGECFVLHDVNDSL